MSGDDLDFETIAAHAGLTQGVDGTTATVGPITASTTFTAGSIDEIHAALAPQPSGYAYARNANPTVRLLEDVVARLEGAEDSVAFGSGMGAIVATFHALGLSPGDSIASSRDIYGVTRSYFTSLLNSEVDTVYVDIDDFESVREAVAAPTVRALFFETISNPLLRVADVEKLARIGHEAQVAVVIDNTFATPYLVRPLEKSADIVIESGTKYLSGHGDVMCGFVAAGESWSARVRASRTMGGAVLSPLEAWLTLRGIRTLPLRVDRQCNNALVVARWLESQPWTSAVYYPGLPSHPHHERARRILSSKFGGMVAFDVCADRRGTLDFIDALHLVTPGTCLGDVESLVLYPALSSHRGLDDYARKAAGIGDGLVRMSIGVESVRDLTRDLEHAAQVSGLAASVGMHR